MSRDIDDLRHPEWSAATTPANTTDQIAATTATRGDIASHEGDATTPAVEQDAQQYDGRDDLDSIEALVDVAKAVRALPHYRDDSPELNTARNNATATLAEIGLGLVGGDEPEKFRHAPKRLAAYIENLEAERDALLDVARAAASVDFIGQMVVGVPNLKAALARLEATDE